MTRKPELADAYTYASALNEALTMMASRCDIRKMN